MLKTLLYIFILAVLGFGVYWFVFTKHDNVFGGKEAAFTFRDTGRIGKIFLADKRGKSIKLVRTERGWMVNDEYPVLKSSLDGLLNILRRQEAQYPVPEAMHNNVVKAMSANSIKVEVYENNGEIWRTFFVGGAAPNQSGTFMLLDGAKKPYVVQVPGFDGYVTPRYSIFLSDWRGRTVFDVSRDSLQSVRVTYPLEPRNSYSIARNGNGFVVNADPVVVNERKPIESRVKDYTGFFTNINTEGYTVPGTGIDTILANTPVRSVVEVKERNGKEQKVTIYWMPINKRSKNKAPLTEDGLITEDYDADRMYAVLNNGADTAVIQTHTFNKLLRKASEFYEQ